MRLENRLMNNALYEVNQLAYRKIHSTATVLIKVHNDALQSLDKNEVTILVILGLSAAFDLIDYGTLIHRIERHVGITASALLGYSHTSMNNIKWYALMESFHNQCI